MRWRGPLGAYETDRASWSLFSSGDLISLRLSVCLSAGGLAGDIRGIDGWIGTTLDWWAKFPVSAFPAVARYTAARYAAEHGGRPAGVAVTLMRETIDDVVFAADGSRRFRHHHLYALQLRALAAVAARG
jgi:hypothetical protein